jgi:Helix-turn-helix domain of resolvase
MTTVTEIAHLRDRIIELLGELDKERNLIAALRGHIERVHEQVERSNQTIRQWIEGFEMTLTDNGWVWKGDPIEGYNDLLNKYKKLVRKWNRYFGSFKTRQGIGRPLQASEVQQARVRKLRKVGHTLREIANETNLSLQTIRTILGHKGGVGRTDKTKNKLRKIELNHHRMNSWRTRNRTGDAQINAVIKDSKNLLKDGDNLLKDGRDLLQK